MRSIDELGLTFRTRDCRIDLKTIKGKRKGQNLYRFRVGRIRVVFEFAEKIIWIVRIDDRGSVYKNL